LTGDRVVRRLAAILVADVAGYTRLMGRDENGTLARLKTHRTERLEPVLARHGGRLVKLTGDGALVEFSSAVDALGAAIEFQQAMAEANRDQPDDTAIVFRIGLHLGDLIADDDDLYGDGVNVAARLEAAAPVGGIVISRTVHEAVAGRLKATFEDLGNLVLKNIERPVQAFRIGWDAADWSAVACATPPSSTVAITPRDEPLALPDKPSIAVLAFINMSGDPEQEYFTDGITEDIITELSRFRSLFVIARNSSFSYKGKSPDVRQIGRDLGVRYVLEGSIRKAATRIRVTAQLIDTLTGNHIWAERYDRVLEDIFAVQEEVTQSIVRAIAPHISEAEVAKVRRRRPDSLSAYEIAVRAYAKAWDAWVKSDRALCDEAIGEARAALAIDPDSTIALTALALAHTQHLMRGTAVDRDAAWRDGMAAATRSIEVDRAGSLGHVLKGVLLAAAPEGTRFGEALESARRGHGLNPHDMQSLIGVAYVENLAGNPGRAIEHLQEALRVSPRDPMRPNMHQQLAMASFGARQYAHGVAYALLGLDEAPGLPPLHVFLATNYIGLGEIEKARAAMAEARRVGPEFVERHLTGAINGRHRERQRVFARIAAGLEDPSAAEELR
jgi:adenylate cyclase